MYRMCLQFGIGMNSNKGVLISAADPEVGTAITANADLLPSAPVSFLLARNDITVGATVTPSTIPYLMYGLATR